MRLIDADALDRMGYVLTRTYQQDKKTMVYETKKLLDVPSAELERKKGHWVDEGTNYACSECHRGCWVNSDYCPWCGADMRGEQDG